MKSKFRPCTRVLPACFAWGLTIGLTGIYFAFPARYLYQFYGFIHLIYGAVLYVFVMANFTVATFMDPGFYPKSQRIDNEDDVKAPLHKSVDINGCTTRLKWCSTCQFYRPPRCSHCSVCDRCVHKFDHHCPWVNNCIGVRNYRYFVTYLISLTLHMMSVLAFSVFSLWKWKEEGNTTFLDLLPIMTIVLCALVGTILFPVVGLTGFHIYLVSKGRTTNEQVTGKFKGGANPFTRGCASNWMFVLWGPQHPKLTIRKHNPLLQSVELVKNPGSTSLENIQVYVDARKNGVANISRTSQYTKLENATAVNMDDCKSITSSIVSDIKITSRIKDNPRTSSLNNLLPEDEISKTGTTAPEEMTGFCMQTEPVPSSTQRNDRNNSHQQRPSSTCEVGCNRGEKSASGHLQANKLQYFNNHSVNGKQTIKVPVVVVTPSTPDPQTPDTYEVAV